MTTIIEKRMTSEDRERFLNGESVSIEYSVEAMRDIRQGQIMKMDNGLLFRIFSVANFTSKLNEVLTRASFRILSLKETRDYLESTAATLSLMGEDDAASQIRSKAESLTSFEEYRELAKTLGRNEWLRTLFNLMIIEERNRAFRYEPEKPTVAPLDVPAPVRTDRRAAVMNTIASAKDSTILMIAKGLREQYGLELSRAIISNLLQELLIEGKIVRQQSGKAYLYNAVADSKEMETQVVSPQTKPKEEPLTDIESELYAFLCDRQDGYNAGQLGNMKFNGNKYRQGKMQEFLDRLIERKMVVGYQAEGGIIWYFAVRNGKILMENNRHILGEMVKW